MTTEAPHSNIDVAELVRGARDGDEASWEALVARFERLVWVVVSSVGLDSNEVLDVVQMTWLRLVEHLDRINEPAKIGAWLTTTAKREGQRRRGERAREAPVDPLSAFRHLRRPTDDTHTVLLRDEVAKVIEALNQLPEKCQVLLRLVLTDPPPRYEEIAEALDIPIGTIGPRRRRCLDQLKALTRPDADSTN